MLDSLGEPVVINGALKHLRACGMLTPSISSILVVQSITYSDINAEMVYVFSIDGVEREFSGRLRNNLGIKGIEYSEELDAFLMLIMPIDANVSKKLLALSWNYVEGAALNFPVILVSS